MPELPEVETVRRELETVALQKTIVEVSILREKNVKSPLNEFKSALEGATIIAIARKGKCLRFDLNNGLSFYSHLRMEGKYFFRSQEAPYDKFDLLELRFEDGNALRYNDVRKFGTFHLGKTEDAETSGPFSEIGPEPFDLTARELKDAFAHKSIPIKAALLDQTIISGIGNIYDSEILFSAKIHPLTPASSLSLKQWEDILSESKRILAAAIEAGGTTIRSFHHGDNIDGLFQMSLQVYGKEGEPCPRCGKPIKRLFIAGRSSYYCPHCSPRPDGKFVLGITGPIHAGKSTVAAFYKERGFLHFDADSVVSSLYGKAACKRRICQLLGPQSYVNGTLNRDYIRATLSIDKKKKKALEQYLYPLVKKEAENFISKAKKGSHILLDVPLLFTASMDELCDYTLLIDASLEQRAKRLEAEGKPTAGLLALNAAYPLEQSKKKADFIVFNDGSIGDLHKQLTELDLH